MARDTTDSLPLEHRNDLVAWMEAGCKPPHACKVGSEHEKILFYEKDLSPVPYEGVRALLENMSTLLHWARIEDHGHLIGLYDPKGGGAISLEPGGQFELSGATHSDIHQLNAEIAHHLAACHKAAAPLGIGFLALGMCPSWSLAQIPQMPKSRYRIMTRYMPKVGTRGLDMMYRTATAQANLDFCSEGDMVAKLRVGLALQPVMTALFANSPFTEGRPNGFLSARSEIWRHTDAARTGMLPFAFEAGMGFERYVDYALDVPMYFIKRGDTYHDVAGASFRDHMSGRVLEGERATQSDWANHLSTIFPEVRLKTYLEMRGADVGDRARIVAQSALMVGLYYDPTALDEALNLISGWSEEDRQTLRDDVPRLGLRAQVAGRPLRDVAREMLSIAQQGLLRRGRDEAHYLAPLETIIATGLAPAEIWLKHFHEVWQDQVAPVFHQARI